jgi:hypothetical protein
MAWDDLKVNFPVLELVDRLCIARIKWERTQSNRAELDYYEAEWTKFNAPQEMNAYIKTLMNIHNQIWELEWQLKSGVEHQLPLEEIGLRAIAIRDWNNKRISLKNQVAKELNCSVQEIKRDHLSEIAT